MSVWRIPSRAVAVSAAVVSILCGVLTTPLGAAGREPGAAKPPANVTCDKWASVSGDDGAVGTYAQPRRTLRGLVPLLAPGQTGCIKAGEILDLSGGWGIVNAGGGDPGNPVTVRSEPGGPQAGMQGLIHVQSNIHDLVLEDVTILGPTTGATKNIMVLIDGDRITVRSSELTYPRGICMQIGNSNTDSRADDIVIERNRIHDCGTSPDLTWIAADSGAHGIYVQHAHDALITNNEIFDNRFRGIQTWPGPKRTVISHNILDGNGSNVNLGHDLPTWVSEDTIVEHNVISNATLFFDLSKNPANIHGTIPQDIYGNVVRDNCVYHPDPTKNYSGTGYTITDNIVADPQYVNRAGKDFSLMPGSPCEGKGPVATPPPGPQLSVSLERTTQNPKVGQPLQFVATVQNTGGQAATVVDLVHTLDESYTAAVGTPSQGTCGAVNQTFDMHCPLGTLAAGATATVNLQVTPTQAINTYLTSIAYPANAPSASSPTVWTMVGPAEAEPGSRFVPLDPVRIIDSRSVPGWQTGPYATPWGPNTTRQIEVTGTAGVPADATAVALNVTVTDTSAASHLTIWPNGQSRPAVSSLNWATGWTLPNAVTAKVGTNGRINVYNSTGSTNVIIDVVGYYVEGSGSGFTPQQPVRLIDSRSVPGWQTGPYATPWGPNTTRQIEVAGTAGVPADATAVALNVTVTDTSTASHLTIWPNGQSRPAVSSLNWATGWTLPNAVTAKVGTNGRINVYNSTGSTNVLIDVVGHYTAAGGAGFHPITPERIADSRPDPVFQTGPFSTPWGAGTTRNLPVTGVAGVPADAVAVLGNVTVTSTTAPSFLTIWPNGETRPQASSLNWATGWTLPNAITTKVGTNGQLRIFNNSGSAHVLLDLAGWFG